MKLKPSHSFGYGARFFLSEVVYFAHFDCCDGQGASFITSRGCKQSLPPFARKENVS